MMDSAHKAPNSILVIHYNASPYGRRVKWYLTLQGIAHAECLQPSYPPRAELDALGIKYRRIPLVAIGRDVYCDSRLCLRALDRRFSRIGDDNAFTPTATLTPSQAAHARLLDHFTSDAGVFGRASHLLPPDGPVFKDKRFLEDRTELTGRKWTKEVQERDRPEALVHMREAFELMEQELRDGRKWILGTDKPSIGDVNGMCAYGRGSGGMLMRRDVLNAAIFPFEWVVHMPGALPKSTFNEKSYPNVYAWIERFGAAVRAAKDRSPKATRLQGQQAIAYVEGSELTADVACEEDPTGLREGDFVAVRPIDQRPTHLDTGRLVGLNPEEVVVDVQSKNGVAVRLHAPRWGFRVAKKSRQEAKI